MLAWRAALSAALISMAAVAADAQTFTESQITVVVPFAAGGPPTWWHASLPRSLRWANRATPCCPPGRRVPSRSQTAWDRRGAPRPGAGRGDRGLDSRGSRHSRDVARNEDRLWRSRWSLALHSARTALRLLAALASAWRHCGDLERCPRAAGLALSARLPPRR
jgi:hypothetical protein